MRKSWQEKLEGIRGRVEGKKVDEIHTECIKCISQETRVKCCNTFSYNKNI